jgi:hypothetical protein
LEFSDSSAVSDTGRGRWQGLTASRIGTGDLVAIVACFDARLPGPNASAVAQGRRYMIERDATIGIQHG